MGYSTDFEGEFQLDRPLKPEHAAFLRAFADTRRMDRDGNKTPPDPIRDAAGLPPAPAYFVSGSGFAGQQQDASILQYNYPPAGQPGLWCKWEPGEGDATIEWNGMEKFDEYVEWLKYLVVHFLSPWGYDLNGEVKWQGEDADDFGVIIAKHSRITTRKGLRSYAEESP